MPKKKGKIKDKKSTKPKVKKKVKNPSKKDLLDISRDWDKEYKKEKNINDDKIFILPTKNNKEYEKEERDKKVLMWSGVIFFMTLIFAFWVLNIKNVIFKTEEKIGNSKTEQINFGEITGGFSDAMAEMKDGLKELQAQIPVEVENENKEIEEQNILPENKNIETSQDEMDELKARLLELEKKMEVE